MLSGTGERAGGGSAGETFEGFEADPENDGEPLRSPEQAGHS